LPVGLIVDRVGYGAVSFLVPPDVTGAIVCLIGLNLARATSRPSAR
jgi:xanthine/uracil permease